LEVSVYEEDGQICFAAIVSALGSVLAGGLYRSTDASADAGANASVTCVDGTAYI
jgi:hypothetical protein